MIMNKRLRYLLLTVLLACMLTGSTAAAASLWSDSGGMFSDRHARAVGDIVTINISQTSTTTTSDSSSNTKSSSVNGNAGTGIFSFLAAASAGSSDSFKTAGAASNKNSVTAQIAAKVVDVKPNGLLVIEGTQMIRQNKDEQKIIISGVIRPEDISTDNTIASNRIADAQIRFDGDGPIAGKHRQGILTQIFNFLF